MGEHVTTKQSAHMIMDARRETCRSGQTSTVHFQPKQAMCCCAKILRISMSRNLEKCKPPTWEAERCLQRNRWRKVERTACSGTGCCLRRHNCRGRSSPRTCSLLRQRIITFQKKMKRKGAGGAHEVSAVDQHSVS